MSLDLETPKKWGSLALDVTTTATGEPTPQSKGNGSERRSLDISPIPINLIVQEEERTHPHKPKGEGRNLKLIGYLIMMGILVLVFMVYNPARELLVQLVQHFHERNLLGISVLVIVGASLILTPIPFICFEIVIGFTFKDFMFGYALCIASKWIGCVFAFFTYRYCFRGEFQETYKTKKNFKIISLMIRDNEPWFLFLIGIIIIPTFMTNASLAILDVKFLSYVAFYLTPTCLKTAFGVWVGVKCQNLIKLFDGSESDPMEVIFIGATIVVSVSVLLAVAFYTKSVKERYEREIERDLLSHKRDELELEEL
eukprot:TRINITY_DN9474_c0_g1_i2.p1 TRINITY_DN9474_c0_g1~~TRINITY_DN9474_c0_g1_i2.p1  ORF type:complete len:312 (+),score=36.62 TRINITY_DN9474_c0_g1_i2:109-1044(+)